MRITIAVNAELLKIWFLRHKLSDFAKKSLDKSKITEYNGRAFKKNAVAFFSWCL